MRLRHVLLIVAVFVCAADAASAGLLGSDVTEPPRAAALAAVPIPAVPPAPPPTGGVPVRDPQPFVSPVVSTLPPVPATTNTDLPEAMTARRAASVAPEVPPPTSAGLRAAAELPASVATVKRSLITVFSAPAEDSTTFALRSPTELGGPRVFLATALQGDWVKVLLPLRPNGSEGWVRATDVDVVSVSDSIVVDLAARTLTWTRGGDVLLTTTVAIGAPSSPTPPGRFYVTDLVAERPGGPLGTWVLALNGYSESFETFNGGDPRLAIHGTNDPGSIGRAASNGCVRVNAGDLATLAAGVPLGTPVTIR